MSDPSPVPYRKRDLRFFLSARLLSTIAMQIQSVAIGWQIYDIARTPLSLGLVGLCQFVPMLLCTLPAGDITDRFNPRLVYGLSNMLQGLCSALFLGLLLFATHQLWAFYGVLVLFGVARGFAMPSGQALLPFLVAKENLPRAISINSSLFTGAVIAGPAIGGFLYAAGPVAVYAVCLLFFCAPALIAFQLGGRHFRPEPGEASRLARIIEGIRFVRSRPVILGAISLDLFAVLLGGATALLPIYARDILHVGPQGLGFLRSAPAAGAFLVAFTLTHKPIARHAGLKMFAAVALFGVATIVFGLSRDFLVSLSALFLLGAGDMISVQVRSTLIQLATPDRMRGRVSSVNALFIGASNELGEFESGGTAALIGTVPAVVAGGIGTLLVVGLWMKLFAPLARVDRMQDVEPQNR